MTDLVVGYIGGSITWQAAGYSFKTAWAIQNAELAYQLQALKIAVNGQVAWEELAWLSNGQFTATPSEVLIDLAANHLSNSAFEDDTIEALVRRVRTLYPAARLFMPIFGVWASISSTTTTDSSATRRAMLVALCQHYAVDYVDVGTAMEAAIAAGHTLSEWYDSGDTTHPNDGGTTYITTLLMPWLDQGHLFGGAGQWTGSLADYSRLSAGSDAYDDPYINRQGIDNDGETGTGWTTNGTARQSGTANDTISWTGTFTSFGLWHTVSGQVAWSVDGGGYTTVNLGASKPIVLITSGLLAAPHTVTFKVVSGTPVFKAFLAI